MTQEFVTLPREVVEQSLNALDAGVKISPNSVLHDRLRAALDQPQRKPLTDDEIEVALSRVNPCALTPKGIRIAGARQIELAHGIGQKAAPQLPVVEQSNVGKEPDWKDLYQKEKRRAEMWIAKYERDIGKLERAAPVGAQPQGELEPIAEVFVRRDGATFAYWLGKRPEAGTLLYTHPQNLHCKSTQARLATLWGYVKPKPPRQPLTDEQEEVAFEEFWYEHTMETFPKDYDMSRFSMWGEKYKPYARKAWFARAAISKSNNIK